MFYEMEIMSSDVENRTSLEKFAWIQGTLYHRKGSMRSNVGGSNADLNDELI